MLPSTAVGSLRLRIEKLDASPGQGGVRCPEGVHGEPNHRCGSEELVVLVV